MKSIKDIPSLLSTLEFLNHSGAGDPIADLPTVKSTLKIQTARALFPKVHTPKKPQVSFSPKKTVHKNIAPVVKPRRVTPQLKETQAHVGDANALAQQAKTLPELKAALESFQGCALKQTAMTTVFADGNVEADLMLIGEAPGADEDRQGLPFVGTSGQLLDNMLYAIGKTRQKDFYIANVIPWRPPGNRPPTVEETKVCLPFIRRHIELKKPKVLIFVGATAAKTLLGTKEGMSKLRGKWFDYAVTEEEASIIPATVLFHPSYLIRSPGQKKHAWADLLKIEKFLLKTL